MEKQILDLLISLNSKVDKMEQDITELKQDVAELKQEVKIIKEDLAEVKQDVTGLKQENKGMKTSIINMFNHIDETMTKQSNEIKELKEILIKHDEKIEILFQLDEVRAEIAKHHEKRLSLLEDKHSILKVSEPDGETYNP